MNNMQPIPPCLSGRNSFRIHSIPDPDPAARLEEKRSLTREDVVDMLDHGYFLPGTIMKVHGHLLRVTGPELSHQALAIVRNIL
jgi:hypothetical protein